MAGNGEKVGSGVENIGALGGGQPEPGGIGARQAPDGPRGDDEWHALQPRRRLQVWTLQEGLMQELNRCRRFGRSFVLMRMTVSRRDERRRLHWPHRHRVAVPDGYFVRDLFRRIDSVWQRKQSFAIVLTECDRTKAARVVERVRDKLAAQSFETEFALAVFPEDGLTSGALMKAVARRSGAKDRGSQGRESSLADALGGRLPAEGIPAPAHAPAPGGARRHAGR
jgi:hypothetical protein